MAIDPNPIVHVVPPEHRPRARLRVSNALWDPVSMLHQAESGLYPSAGLRSRYRAEEIAYWRHRAAGLDVADDADLDARPIDE